MQGVHPAGVHGCLRVRRRLMRERWLDASSVHFRSLQHDPGVDWRHRSVVLWRLPAEAQLATRHLASQLARSWRADKPWDVLRPRNFFLKQLYSARQDELAKQGHQPEVSYRLNRSDVASRRKGDESQFQTLRIPAFTQTVTNWRTTYSKPERAVCS